MREPDFIPVDELARLTGHAKKSFYNTHSSGRGPLAEILVKLGGRLGAWRADYDAFLAAQRKFRDAA